MSRFQLGDPDSKSSTTHSSPPLNGQTSYSDSDSDLDFDSTTLPFPAPLTRASFSQPSTFSPSDYLSSLSSRHQTLEDLRLELRNLSQSLNRELLDLVNENYADFLNLGSSLRGGDEKVEEVRVGMLGFRREVEGLVGVVEGRREEVKELIDELKGVRAGIGLGRRLLEVEERVARLEGTLMIEDANGIARHGSEVLDDLDEDDDLDDFGSPVDDSDDEGLDNGLATNGTRDASGMKAIWRRLQRHVEQYQILRKLMEDSGGSEHAFIESYEPRVEKIRSTLSLDLQNLQKQEVSSNKLELDVAGLEAALEREITPMLHV